MLLWISCSDRASCPFDELHVVVVVVDDESFNFQDFIRIISATFVSYFCSRNYRVFIRTDS